MQRNGGDVRLQNGPIMLTFRGLGRYWRCNGKGRRSRRTGRHGTI